MIRSLYMQTLAGEHSVSGCVYNSSELETVVSQTESCAMGGGDCFCGHPRTVFTNMNSYTCDNLRSHQYQGRQLWGTRESNLM